MNLHRVVGVTVFTVMIIVCCIASGVWLIREDGIGPAQIGMSLIELNTALNEKFSTPKDKDDQGCFYVQPAKHPHVSFMVEDGRLARVDVDAPGMATKEGIQVGDTEAHALKVYGAKLKIEPHHYTGPEGHYLTVRSDSGRYGIRFETDGAKIVNFYAGSFQAIQYVEGCL